MLTKMSDFRKEEPAGVASRQVMLASNSRAIGVYAYFHETGLLGSGTDWAVVPDEFKAWMQRKTAATGPTPAQGARK